MKKLAFVFILAAATLMAADGAELFKKCIACHGVKAEKKALGKSGIIAELDTVKIEEALAEYKAGTRNMYGMGAVMQGQVGAFSAEDIKAVAAYVTGLK